MERLNRYPRGFTARVVSAVPMLGATEVTVEDVNYDPTIEMLYKLYVGRAINPDRWDFNRQVIARCSQLFGDFHEWVVLQVARNDNIYGLNLEFIHDTLQFIRTGQRDMPVATWLELMTEYPDRHHGTATLRRLEALSINREEFKNYIGRWCSHPGGLEDMLCTARALFGLAKKPMLTHPL